MVKLSELKRAVNDILKTNIPEIALHSGDVTEGFSRPSLFSKFDQTYRTDFKDSFMREVTLAIYYFPQNRDIYEEEVLDIQDRLEDAFRKGLTVKDRHIHIADDIDAEVVDGVLQMFLDLHYYDKAEDDETPGALMEELFLNE